MNQEIKAKWVAALRSGVYEQGAGALKVDDEHCCLGVLCEIHRQETGFTVADNLRETRQDENIGVTVLKWSGLTSGEGARVTINGENIHLTTHNDNGRTFMEIADAIEAQL